MTPTIVGIIVAAALAIGGLVWIVRKIMRAEDAEEKERLES